MDSNDLNILSTCFLLFLCNLNRYFMIFLHHDWLNSGFDYFVAAGLFHIKFSDIDFVDFAVVDFVGLEYSLILG